MAVFVLNLSDIIFLRTAPHKPRLSRVNSFWCQRDTKAANNTICPHLKECVPSFYAVGFVLRAICKNKITTLGQRLHSSQATLGQRLHSSPSLLLDCFVYQIIYQQFSQTAIWLISLIKRECTSARSSTKKIGKQCFTPMTSNLKWTGYSHHLQKDRIAIQHAETKTWIYDRRLRRKNRTTRLNCCRCDQGRIKGGQRGQLPRAPRCKGAPRGGIYLFQLKYSFGNFSWFRSDTRLQLCHYIPILR